MMLHGKRDIVFKILCIVFCLILCATTYSQQQNDTFFLAKKKGWLGKLGKSISVETPLPDDSVPIATKNIDPFIIYAGAVIRSIKIEKVGFGESVNDTTKKNKNFFNDLGESLHKSTKEKFIRQNLFFKAGDTLRAYLLAENDRYLRDQPYLQDARIIVRDSDSADNQVDVIVLFKDVFSISGDGSASGTSIFAEGQDDNFLGSGQRIKVQQLFDLARRNQYAAGFEYLKRNIQGSFIDLTMGYQGMAPAFNSGRREETTGYISFDLPLVSPYRLWTGSFQASVHYTKNNYISDSLYWSDFNYKYYSYDAWIGYNISAKSLLHENGKRYIKNFVAIRAAKNNFVEVPNIYKTTYNYQYANLMSVLVAFTTFKQEYYRTNYIYGFGRNEDVPEGFNVSAIGGWTNKNNYVRPYLGLDASRELFTKKQQYINLGLRLGGYFYNKNFQDISMLMSVESFSKLRRLGSSRWLLRHFLSGSVTQQLNTFLNEPLRLNSTYGIPAYENLLTYYATSRATMNCESVFYNTWKFLGFNFAPFVFGNVTYLKAKGAIPAQGDIFTSWGSGVRTRNENLVFGTIELRVQYFPRVTPTMTPWNISVQTGLQFRYISQYIKRPDFVSAN
ncbi:MAG: hypothetical protein KGO81_12595 [Bacteroidota bacterium]|nr:hypothetical protein [Bacteroidota bacterium]